MDTEAMTALDDEVDQNIDTGLISVAPFSPPSLSASQYKQLELLQHLSLYSELLILFSGEKGTGKTFIAQALIASREDPDQSLMIDADFSLSYLDVLQQLAQRIDLADLDDAGLLEQQIVQHCEQLLAEEQGSFLLIIDQADQLTNQVLMHLNQLALIQPNALHVMLLGTPIIEEVLLELPEPHAPLHIMQIDSLTEDESEIILLEQFPEQDWSGEQVDYMLQQAKGSPGKLMYIAQRLSEGEEWGTEVKTKFPITHVAALLLIASALLVSFLYKNSQTTAIGIEEAVVSAPVLIETKAAETLDVLKPVEEIVEEEVDFNFIEPTEVTAANKTMTSSDESPKTVPSPVVKQVAVEPAVQPLAASNSDKEEGTGVSQPTEPKVVEAQARKNFTDTEQALLAAPATSFVAQLFGSHTEKSAQAFIDENQQKAGSLLKYRTEHKGKPWFVVVSGPFTSKQVAKKEVAKLPQKLRNQQPWVRSIEPIQALLNTRQ